MTNEQTQNQIKMKKQLLLFAGLFLISFSVFAQNKVNLVIFSEDGDPFYMYVNGVRQNDKPETNVKVTNLAPNISLRVVFENKALPELKQSMALEPGFEHTARIKRDMKKQLKLRYFGQSPLTDEPTPGVATVAYHSVENPVSSDNSSNASINQNSHTTVTSSTTTTKNGNAGIQENVSVNINVSGVGMNMNVSGMDDNATVHTTSSTTVTSSSSSSSSGSFQESSPKSTAVVEPVKSGCDGAMSPANFSSLKKSVESKPFSDTKMSTAKVATKNACLSVNQVKEICKLFNMDEEKLTFAKYAYDRCVDKANYYQVSEVFSFSSTTDEFNSFLEQ